MLRSLAMASSCAAGAAPALLSGCTAIPYARRADVEYSPALLRALRSDGAQIDLFGTLHTGLAEFFPLPLAVENAFDAAGVLAIEIDAKAHWNELVAGFRPFVRLPPGRSLSTLLPASTLDELRDYFKFPEAVWRDLQTMQPWWIANFRMGTELDRSERVQEVFGAEQWLLDRARAARKKLLELELPLEQVLGLAGGDLEEQVSQLSTWLSIIKERGGLMTDLLSAWRRGDLDGLVQLKARTWGDERHLSSLRRRFFAQRDQRMARRLSDAAHPNTKIFVAVGAYHLVGQDSLPAALQGHGFQIERIETATRYQASSP